MLADSIPHAPILYTLGTLLGLFSGAASIFCLVFFLTPLDNTPGDNTMIVSGKFISTVMILPALLGLCVAKLFRKRKTILRCDYCGAVVPRAKFP